MSYSCPEDDCDFESDSTVGLGVHRSRSHNLPKELSVECKQCSVEFNKRRIDVEQTDKHFCSRDCHFLWKSQNKTGDYKILNCDYCGTEKKVYPKELEDYDNHFCSSDCKNNYHSNNYTGDKHWRNGERSGKGVSCHVCGNEFYRRPSRINTKNFCSKSCEAEHISDRQLGEGNSNWQGGYEGYYGSNWNQKRKETLERDNYECQVCGMTRDEHYNSRGTDLEVHHKIPIGTFDEAEDANYLINLVTTCRSCHGQLDTISRREANGKPTIPV